MYNFVIINLQQSLWYVKFKVWNGENSYVEYSAIRVKPDLKFSTCL